MKTSLFIVMICILLYSKTDGQDFKCPVTKAWLQAQSQKKKGETTLSKTSTTNTPITGSQNLVVLYVDYPEGRMPDGSLPVNDGDTINFQSNASIDAIGGMGYVNGHKKIRKYTYDDYWDMFFSVGIYYGSVHPDFASHGIQAFGSFREYYREVSYNKIDIVPATTHGTGSNMYETGIVNAIDTANGKKYIRWIKMPKSKISYTDDNGDVKAPFDTSDVNPVIRAARSRGETTLDIDDFIKNHNGKVIIVGAGDCKGGITEQYSSVREKRWGNYDNRSTLDGIWVSVHEFGHQLGFGHLASSCYDPMNVTLTNAWTKHLYCPPHFNPIYKLQAGWISPDSVIKIRSNGSTSLPPIHNNQLAAVFTIYGDALRNNDYTHSEYLVAEYRKREGFNRFSGGQDATSFTGGVLIWHYSAYNTFSFDPDNQESEIGLKIAGYCDANNHSNFRISSGDPQDFFYTGHNLINASSDPNTNSIDHLTTNISLSNFSTSNGQINIDANYSVTEPTWNYFIKSGYTWNQTLGGFIYIDAGAINLNTLTISPGAEIHIAPHAELYLNSVTADASSGQQIKIKSATSIYDPNLINVGSYCQLSSSILKNCMISNLEIGTKISNPFTQIILNNVIYDKCGTSIYLEGASGGTISPFPSFTNLSFSNMVIAGAIGSNIRRWSFANNQEFIIPINATVQIGQYNKFLMGVNSDIICNGAIIASGTITKPITFTSSAAPPIPGSWNWVQVNKGNSVFQYCTFEYGTYGLYLLNASSGSPVDIENCIFRYNSYYGIRLSWSNAKIKSCEIKNNSTNGILCSYNPDIKFIGNSIHDNSLSGIYSMSGNFLEFYGNVITSNGSYGLSTAGNNHVHLGQPYTWEGYNTIKNNASDEVNIGSGGSSNSIEMVTASIHDASGAVVNNYSSNPAVYTTYCHWGPNRLNRFYGPITFSVSFDDSASWDGQTRTDGSPLGKVSPLTIPDSIPWILDPRIPDAEKVKKCKNIIAKNPKSEEAKTALDWLYFVLRPDFVDNKLSERDNFYGYLQELYKANSDANIGKTSLRYMIYWKILIRDNATVIQLSNEALKVITAEDKKWLLIDLALTHSHIGEKSQARNILQDLKQNYGIDNELISIINNDINEIYVPNSDEQNQIIKQAQPEEQVVNIPKEFGLVQNYPNPFNPTTTINYQIPNAGLVTLKVFDMLGREVATLVDGMKDAGYYTTTFDGFRFSSGVYFVRITAIPQDGYVPFTKTMKMLMMK